MNALDAVIEIFTWIGFGGALLFGAVAVIFWATDGTWLPADALVDHEPDGTYVRWFDADGDANSARSEASDLAGVDRVAIWYRYGWRDRMRLTRRPPGWSAVLWAAAALLGLGVASLIASGLMLFVGR